MAQPWCSTAYGDAKKKRKKKGGPKQKPSCHATSKQTLLFETVVCLQGYSLVPMTLQGSLCAKHVSRDGNAIV